MPNIQLEMMRKKYPHFNECTIQLFDDTKQWRDLARKLDQNKFSKEDLERWLEYYNKKGAGVFFSINSMNPWERDKINVTHVNAWACEVDNLSKKDQIKLISVAPLAPSLIIESHKSFHMYRFAKDWTIENWTKVCRWLRNFFWGDPAIASDISRVLRVPGYYHMKDSEHPFMCDITDGNWEYYTEEEMLKAYPDTETLAEKEARAIKKEQQLKQAIWNDDTWDRIRAMDSKAMLEKISWTSLVWWDIITFRHNSNWTEQIFCNGKSTGCWIDKAGKIWSTDKGGPNWTNWIAWYGWVDWKEIYRWIKEEFPFVLPEKKEERSVDSILSAIDEDVNTELHTYYYPKGFEKFNSFLSWELVTIVAPSNSWKTTFAMDIIKRNTAEWRKCFYINWEFKIETVRVNRWLRKNWKTKEALWDKNPLTPEERKDMEKYVADSLWQFWYDCSPMGYKLGDLVELITEKTKEWYELFVIDSLSKIQGNLTNEARSHQNQTMETFLALVQKLNIAVILLHHTNKFWKFEGSQKIFDFSNVFITMKKCEEDFVKIPSRTFKLEKDKYVNDVELEMYYDIKTWTYTESLSEIAEMRRNNFNC